MMTSQDKPKEASLSASPQAPPSSKALFDKFDFSLDPSTFDLDAGFDIHPHHAESVAELMNKPHDTPVKPSLASIEHSPNNIAPQPPSPRHDPLPFGAYANYQFGNYLIQMPLPEPDRFRIARIPMYLYFQAFFPMLFLGLCTTLSCIFWLGTQNAFLGLGTAMFMLLTLIVVMLQIPFLISPKHATPYETAQSLIHLHQTRSIFAASRLMAVPAESKCNNDLIPLWRSSLPSWPKALNARLTHPAVHKIHQAVGKATDRAAILLVEQETTYYLIPVVHLKGGWYVTDPSMKPLPKPHLTA